MISREVTKPCAERGIKYRDDTSRISQQAVQSPEHESGNLFGAEC
jgi:hypothetical protein